MSMQHKSVEIYYIDPLEIFSSRFPLCFLWCEFNMDLRRFLVVLFFLHSGLSLSIRLHTQLLCDINFIILVCDKKSFSHILSTVFLSREWIESILSFSRWAEAVRVGGSNQSIHSTRQPMRLSLCRARNSNMERIELFESIFQHSTQQLSAAVVKNFSTFSTQFHSWKRSEARSLIALSAGN